MLKQFPANSFGISLYCVYLQIEPWSPWLYLLMKGAKDKPPFAPFISRGNLFPCGYFQAADAS
ncbi:hypothetical protein B6259_02680 [Ruminococcaceae bacterium CPB6]|uniref:Uncharacterized protein n=1 Tax=Caproicibacterium lactatifermentans TaxID=2666138 RepID=A0ABX6PWA8_9FIRM|nr:hypothetical protein B6259_02680 [Ruminococcaceae bacterium CPB6]QKO30599.1 hypothetical protein GKP14_06030 [Caproicibacterium lactatifermentans]